MGVLGIDAGGTLTKIVYEERGKLHYKTFRGDHQHELENWIRILAPQHRFFVTGGRADQWRSLSQDVAVVNEFDAVHKGTVQLMAAEKNDAYHYLLINIGTGTSFIAVDENGPERLFGSGMGGGTFLGLGSMLTGITDFHDLVALSDKGVRGNVDLLVKDVYTKGDSPVDPQLTAANFGKMSMNSSHADKLRALSNMIGETIILLASQAAKTFQIKDFVFVGGAVEYIPSLREDLSQFQSMLAYTPHFPMRGSFAGALGAYQIGLEGAHSQNRQ
ncbi:type II pantothenate kinase [Bacillus sp. KH172YL63]|uniref:type II pantothenate kinase n=1 Tax=Bacillus sp. KH172YL63 TaxID=2709784 RepID=UPI0013E5012A|nr:type II pantothenate kinase [Bacillus sp. KH172YL63]BCB03544.1 type II pantothenate kinase [Bacillus sp. KH172YL63]